MRAEGHCADGLVVDTNVMAHSEQGSSTYNVSAVVLLTWLKSATDLSLVLDDKGKSAPDLRTSQIASEYYETLTPQGFAMSVFIHLLGSERVKFAALPDRSTRTLIARLIPKNKRDRAVLGAAAGCPDRFLISNDFSDFSPDVRKACMKQLGVAVVDSEEAVA